MADEGLLNVLPIVKNPLAAVMRRKEKGQGLCRKRNAGRAKWTSKKQRGLGKMVSPQSRGGTVEEGGQNHWSITDTKGGEDGQGEKTLIMMPKRKFMRILGRAVNKKKRDQHEEGGTILACLSGHARTHKSGMVGGEKTQIYLRKVSHL